MLNCLTTIVGLTDRDCNCFEDARPEGYNASDSGYYLTDPEHGIDMLPGLFETADCGDGSVWDVLTKARNTAILDFESDLGATIYNSYAQRFSGWSGIIGKTTWSGLISQTKSVMGLRWHTYGHRGSKAVVKRIGIGIDQSATVTVRVLNSEFEQVATASIEAVANEITYVDVEALTLDLYDEQRLNGRAIYYFLYDLPSGARPINNTVNCCGRKPAWMQYMDIDGIKGTTDETLRGANSDCNGLSIDAFIQCSPLSWVCKEDALEGFQINLVVARTIQFRAAAKLIQKILDSPNTSYYTLLNREALYGKRNHLNKRYEENIQWLAANAPTNETDCLKCRDNKLKKASILV